MHEHPLLFSAPMVRALLARKKTQTRRILNMDRLRVYVPRLVVADFPFGGPKARGIHLAGMNRPGAVYARLKDKDGEETTLGLKPGEFDFVLPWIAGKTHLGDYGGERKEWTITPTEPCRIWVKETHGFLTGNGIRVVYRADADPPRRLDGTLVEGMKWKPSIFMRREHSRIALDVASVRLQHLHDITEKDAIAEGVDEVPVSDTPRQAAWDRRQDFSYLWDIINGKRAPWNSNPWVARIQFEVAEVKERWNDDHLWKSARGTGEEGGHEGAPQPGRVR
jgi:hypothetical protein